MKKLLSIIGILGIIVVMGYLSYESLPKAQSAAPGGMQTKVSTSSVITLQNGQAGKTWTIAASSTCVARIVSTTDQAIMLKFATSSSGYNLNGMAGHVQTGSTTVAYDAAIYGCDDLLAATTAAGGATNTQITITELQGFR